MSSSRRPRPPVPRAAEGRVLTGDEQFVGALLAALAEARLEAVIVGVTAAVLQGAPLLTRDVDLLVRDTPLARRKLEQVARALGAASSRGDLSTTVHLQGAAFPVDVLFGEMAGGLRFESVRSRAVRVRIGGREAVVASLADVIRSKGAAGRPKDLAALPILRDTLRVKEALGKPV